MTLSPPVLHTAVLHGYRATMQDTAWGETVAGLGLAAFVSQQVVELPRVPTLSPSQSTAAGAHNVFTEQRGSTTQGWPHACRTAPPG